LFVGFLIISLNFHAGSNVECAKKDKGNEMSGVLCTISNQPNGPVMTVPGKIKKMKWPVLFVWNPVLKWLVGWSVPSTSLLLFVRNPVLEIFIF
jgi:hypothetical protein